MVKSNLELRACDFDRLSNVTENVFTSVLAVGKRSNKLLESAKLAFRAELEDLNIREGEDHSLLDSDIQELVSKRYEMARKPLLKALNELLDNKLSISYQAENEY